MKRLPVKSVNTRLLAVFACFLWSTAFLGVKFGLQYISPFLFAGIRFTLAGVVVGLVFRPEGYRRQVWDHWKMILVIGFFQTFLLYALFFSSLTSMRASTGALINGLNPLVTAVIAHFFMPGDRLNSRRFFSLVIAVSSMALITLSGMDPGGSAISETGGILLMVGALLSSAAATVIVARTSDDLDPFVLTSSQLTFGGVTLLFVGLVKEGLPEIAPPPLFYIALIWLVFVTAGGFSIWFYLLKIRKEPVSHLTIWKSLVPVSGSVLSWILLKNDSPSLFSVCGMVLTAFSIMLFYADGSAIKKLRREKV